MGMINGPGRLAGLHIAFTIVGLDSGIPTDSGQASLNGGTVSALDSGIEWNTTRARMVSGTHIAKDC